MARLLVLACAVVCTAVVATGRESRADVCAQLETYTSQMGQFAEQKARNTQNRGRWCEASRRGIEVLGQALVLMRANVGSCGITEKTAQQVAQIVRASASEHQSTCR